MVRPHLHREAKPQAIHSLQDGCAGEIQRRPANLRATSVKVKSTAGQPQLVDPSFGFISSKLFGPDLTFYH